MPGSPEQVPRSCGECSECCTVMYVEGNVGGTPLVKAAGTKCKFVKEGNGCAVYADRPKACSGWSCMWKHGQVGTEADRPDKTGIVMQEIPYEHRSPPMVAMIQSRKGAIATPYGQKEIRHLLDNGRVILKDTGYLGQPGKRMIIAKSRRQLSPMFMDEVDEIGIPVYASGARIEK